MSETDEIVKRNAQLQEILAVDRTRMANDRTLLSFIRTSLYFAVAGLSLNSLLNIRHGDWIELVSWLLSVFILFAGLIKYYQQRKKLRETQKRFFNDRPAWDDDDD